MHAQAPERYSAPPTALLRITDVAAILGVHRNTVHRLVSRGELRQIRVGRLARFRPVDVERYLERDSP